MAQFQLGSISTGTLRTLDLLEAFAGEAEARCGDMATKAVSTARIYLDPDAIVDDEQAQETLDELRFLLEDSCPPFVYFGTHPGDGADFGFWPDMNRLDEELYNQTGAPHLDKVPSYCLPMHQDYPYGEIELKDDNVIVQLSDHGNVTVMDMERNVIWSVV
jgi:hypothetical protein|tara:strand:+ start:88 stop:570 length:483 start_codon:yes stop_codon:yes gene_type:complete